MKYTSALFVSGFLAFSTLAGELKLSSKEQNLKYFKEVTSKLDPGGTSYVYFTPVNAYKMLDETFSGARKLITNKMSESARRKEIIAVFDLVESFAKSSGISEIKGCGFSSIGINKDLYRGRCVIYAPKRRGALWKASGKTRKFDLLQKLPDNTAMAYYSQIRMDVIWSWIKKELAKSNIGSKHAIKAWEEQAKSQGVDIDKLLKSTTGEIGMVLTVDMNKKEKVNLGMQTINASNFQVAFFIGVKDNKLFRLIQARTQPVQPGDKAAPKDRIVFEGVPMLPPFIKPAIVNKEGYLFISSHPELIDTLTDGAKKPLVNTPKFKKYAAGLQIEKGLGFEYVDTKFSKFVIEMQKAFSQNDVFQQVLAEVQGLSQTPEGLGIWYEYDDGIMSVVNTNIDPAGHLLYNTVVLPMTLISGALVPVLGKAQKAANTINKVSTMKQLGLALKMYAMDNKDIFPAKSGMTSFDLLVKQDYISKKEIQMPPGDKLFYIGGMNENMSTNLPLIILIPKNGNKNIVLFLDGRVEQFNKAGMSDCIEVVKFLNNRFKYKAQNFKLLQEQARKLDSGMVK